MDWLESSWIVGCIGIVVGFIGGFITVWQRVTRKIEDMIVYWGNMVCHGTSLYDKINNELRDADVKRELYKVIHDADKFTETFADLLKVIPHRKAKMAAQWVRELIKKRYYGK
jgi:hypothetical protein